MQKLGGREFEGRTELVGLVSCDIDDDCVPFLCLFLCDDVIIRFVIEDLELLPVWPFEVVSIVYDAFVVFHNGLIDS